MLVQLPRSRVSLPGLFVDLGLVPRHSSMWQEIAQTCLQAGAPGATAENDDVHVAFPNASQCVYLCACVSEVSLFVAEARDE